MSFNLEELIQLRQVIEECKKLAYKQDTINRLLESERIITREIRLRTTNFVTGEPFAQGVKV